jgi:hypothetical protein
MKRETIVIGILAMLAMSGIAVAAEGELGITFDTTWVSKYIWRGVDVLGDKGAIQPSINMDLGNGFSAGVWASYGCGSGTVNADEYNYILSYGNAINEGLDTQVNYAVSWIYYDFIDMPSSGADAQEINLSVSMPNICPIGTVPSYTVIKMWASESDSASSSLSGWIHVIGLDYALTLDGFIGNNPEQVIDLKWDVTYNGSAGVPGTLLPGGTIDPSNVDHDWSHMTFGISTGIDLPDAGTITPGVFYQVTMDKSVNNEDELWTGISYNLNF